MDVGTLLSVAQTLFAALHCSELKEMLSFFGYESQLDDLQKTVNTINAVLRDAETKQELSHEAQNWIEELKEAVLEADDLFDEFVTLAQQKQLVKADGSLSKKVSSFFSLSKNPLSLAYRMSRGIKDIKKKLDAIAYNSQFSFKLDLEPIRQRRQETCSYVNEVEIIGRKDDLDNIVGTLLDTNVQRDVSFLSIVGIGGLGKTALAQLVYNDPRVISSFSLRMWACVSDEDQKQLDVKEILIKILNKNLDGLSMEKVQIQVREQIANKKYLLVLDDVWTEKQDQWRALANLLAGGQRGSWVVVTTRSQETSRIIGDGAMYKLPGLSDENSWLLFHRVAFGAEQSNPPDDLVKIGQEIIGKCARVPLAIRVVGSLLYGQEKSKWLCFRNIGLADIRDSQNDIMPILKLSYHHLEFPLKSCLCLCALFPKDSKMYKKRLISIWMAQGYIVPLDEGQSIEDAGEEYFSILARRCFIQDIKDWEDGRVTCKIHDLIHDIAQKVSGKEICSTNTFCGNLDKRNQHLYLAGSEGGQYCFQKSRIRSIFLNGSCTHWVKMDQIVAKESIINCKWLRALNLSWSNIISLPGSIGELLHLRYLDLSGNKKMEMLPKSITKLHNLETLELEECDSLKELPKDLHRLIKLRALNIEFDKRLKFMPRGMGKLSCLQYLSDFILGGERSCASWKQWFYGLDDLKALDKLRDRLHIKIILPNEAENFDMENGAMEGSYLRNKVYLNHIRIQLTHEEAGTMMDGEEPSKLMEELQPHPNLRGLELDGGYQRVKLPSWVVRMTNLVQLRIEHCRELKKLPPLGNLHHLNDLLLLRLPNLEYIQEDCSPANSNFMLTTSESGTVEHLALLPSLELLSLWEMPKFTGWRREIGVVDNNNNDRARLQLLRFNQLKSLSINRCPQLAGILICPRVENLGVTLFNERLQIITDSSWEENLGVVPRISSWIGNAVLNLKEVEISNLAWLNSLPIETFHCLERLIITDERKAVSLGEGEKVFRGCSSSLRMLRIQFCPKLRSVVYGGLEHLVALEELNFIYCNELTLKEEQERGDGIGIGIGISMGMLPWQSLHHSLRALTLSGLPRLETLPDGMQYLTSLQVISLYGLKSVESMPSWMPRLTSLRHLQIHDASDILKQRCQENPPGEDWPCIQHIPSIDIQ